MGFASRCGYSFTSISRSRNRKRFRLAPSQSRWLEARIGNQNEAALANYMSLQKLINPGKYEDATSIEDATVTTSDLCCGGTETSDGSSWRTLRPLRKVASSAFAHLHTAHTFLSHQSRKLNREPYCVESSARRSGVDSRLAAYGLVLYSMCAKRLFPIPCSATK